MKLCSKCGEEKPEEAFPPDKRRNSRRARCRVCTSQDNMEYAQRNLEEHRSRQRKSVKQLRLEKKTALIQAAGGRCVRCGYHKCVQALEFHHRERTDKDFGIARKILTSDWAILLQEIEKCDLLCANCHRETEFK